MAPGSPFPKRWLLVGHHPVPFDGPATFQRHVARSLLARGCQLDILTYGHNPYADIAASHPERCVVHLDADGRSRRAAPEDLRRAASRLRSWRPEALFCTFSGFPDYLALLAMARVVGVRHVAVLHGTDWVEPAWKRKRYFGLVETQELWFRRLSWWARRASKAVTLGVFHSDPQRMDWQRRLYRRDLPSALVLAPIDGRRFAPATGEARVRARERAGLADAFVVGTVGRLSPDKGIDVLIRAFALHRRANPSSRLVIVGDGALAGELKRLAEDEVGGAVTFAGATATPEEYYRLLDVFVLSSRAETLGIATLEAMACGVPCIVTDLPGPKRLAGDGRFARVVPREDPAALAAAIDDLSRDAAARASLADAGRARASECFEERVPEAIWSALGLSPGARDTTA